MKTIRAIIKKAAQGEKLAKAEIKVRQQLENVEKSTGIGQQEALAKIKKAVEQALQRRKRMSRIHAPAEDEMEMARLQKKLGQLNIELGGLI